MLSFVLFFRGGGIDAWLFYVDLVTGRDFTSAQAASPPRDHLTSRPCVCLGCIEADVPSVREVTTPPPFAPLPHRLSFVPRKQYFGRDVDGGETAPVAIFQLDGKGTMEQIGYVTGNRLKFHTK